MKTGSLLIPLIVLSIGCANEPNNIQANENASDTEVQSEILGNTSKVETNLEEQKHVLGGLTNLQEQVKNGDYSQIEDFISQIQAYLSAQPNQMTEEERLNFPHLSKKDLIDFLKATNMDSLKANWSFDKKYVFGSAPKEYEPDSEKCPDLLRLSIDEETEGFALLQNNSFLVDESIGCAESSTIYFFEVVNGRMLLKRVDYAG